jgi:hypothetical protein
MTPNGVADFVRTCRDRSGRLVETDEDTATLEATRFGAEILHLHGAGPTEGDLRFVTAARKGPAYLMHDNAGSPSLGATYYSLRLHQLAGRPVPDADTVTRWTSAALVADGIVRVDVDDLFYGVRSLMILDAEVDEPFARAVRAFLRDCAPDGQGCALLPGHAADIERTYCAVAIHQWLGTDDDYAAARLHTEFVAACEDGDGHVTMSPQPSAWSLATAYWGSRAAELLRMPWPWARVAAIMGHCTRPDGGFGRGTGSTLWETYCAVRVMTMAGAHLESAI